MIELKKNYSKSKSKSSAKRATFILGWFIAVLFFLSSVSLVSADEKESTDDPSPWIVAYFSRIQLEVEKGWLYPVKAIERKEAGQVTVRMVISRAGGLLDVSIDRSSSIEELDEAAKDAVKKAAPFDPFPPSLEQDSVAIKLNFSYLPQ
jgi:TonB family protein